MPGWSDPRFVEQQFKALEARVSGALSRETTSMVAATATGFPIPNSPVWSIPQNDTYYNQQDLDVGYPLQFDYLIPSNVARVTDAKLTMVLRNFRNYTGSAITEATAATNVTVAFDSVDKTSALGGPFTTDQVELNVLPYLPVTSGAHLIELGTATQAGRITALLRLSMYVNASKAG